jgi:hypothetical protein
LTQPVLSADSILGVHLKTNGAKHPKLKELFFPSAREDSPLSDRVARFTSVFWVAQILVSEANKHWKAVTSAIKNGTKQPAPFFFSQEEKDALKAAKDQQLKDARTKSLQETQAAREKKRAEKAAALKRQKTHRAGV